jgi:hypothetical protein
MATIHLIFVGLSVLVYQLTIYPLLSKYFGPVKIFRPAVVREKYIFVEVCLQG